MKNKLIVFFIFISIFCFSSPKEKRIQKNCNNLLEEYKKCEQRNYELQLKISQLESQELQVKYPKKIKINNKEGIIGDKNVKKTKKDFNPVWIFLSGFLSAMILRLLIKRFF